MHDQRLGQWSRWGYRMPEALQAHFAHFWRAGNVMDTRLRSLPASALIDACSSEGEQAGISWFIAEESHQVVGFATREDVTTAARSAANVGTLGRLARKDYIAVPEDAAVLDVVVRMLSAGASTALVLAGPDATAESVKGVISREKLIAFLEEK